MSRLITSYRSLPLFDNILHSELKRLDDILGTTAKGAFAAVLCAP